MSELNKIQAPILNDSYGENIEETFNKIDANFGILANKNLWKGDPGLSLVSLNIPWKVILSDPAAEFIEYPEDSGLKFKNYYDDIKSAFSVISSNEDDWNAVVEQLINIPPEESTPVIGLGTSIIASFLEPVEGDNSIIEFKTITPYVFMDERFRTLTTQEELNKLANCVDMSCVISMDCVNLDNSVSQYKFICTQSFPTLYFNDSEDSDGGLYWIINGSRTLIRAQGPAGTPGTTGNFYIGLADEGTINDEAWRNLDVNDSVSIYLSHLLVPGLTAEMIEELEDTSRVPFVNLTNGDYDNLIGEPYDGAPVIVLKQPEEVSEQLNPYYISALTRSMNGDEIKWYASVSPYNVCYAYLTDAIVKQAIMNNVWIIPESGSIPGSVNKIPSYPIRTGENDSSGYAMWVQPSSHPAQPSISGRPEFIFGHVEDIKRPILGSGIVRGSFVFDGNVAEGSNSVASGNSHAEGHSSVASGEASHAEGSGSTASGEASHAEGYSTASGSYSHAEGSSTASGSYSHAEGWSSSAEGSASHAEGTGSMANGTGSHAEGGSTAFGNYSHAEGLSGMVTYDLNSSQGFSSVSGRFIDIGSSSYNQYKPKVNDYFIFPPSPSHYIYTNVISKITGIGPIPESAGKAWRAYISPQYPPFSSGDNIDFQLIKFVGGASGDYSHAEGYYTTASGSASHAEGYSSSAEGDYSHAEGSRTKANDNYSHAEGYRTTASGEASHAEGNDNTASGINSHVEGGLCVASGSDSHAEGYNVTASGAGSHAEGYGTTASGSYSHAEGYGTMTKNTAEHACGKYNAPGYIYSRDVGGSESISTEIFSGTSASNTHAIIFSIGGGDGNATTGSSHRSNAFFITDNGEGWVLAERGSNYTYWWDGTIHQGTGEVDRYKRVF